MTLARIRERLDELRALPRGWYDGSMGNPITPAAIATAEREAMALMALGETLYLYPRLDGGVNVETEPVDVICRPDGSTEVIT